MKQANTPGHEPPTAMQVALSNLRSGFIGVGIFSFFLNLLMLATPLYMLSVYQRVLTSGHQGTLLYLTRVTVFALLILGGLYTWRGWLLSRIRGWLSAKLRDRVLAASLGSTLSGSPAGAQPLRDLGQLQSFIGGQGVATLFDSPWVPVFVFVIWLMHPWLGVLALCSAIVLFVLAWLNELITRKPQRAANQQQSKAYQFAESSLRNAEIVQALGMMPSLQSHWQSINAEALQNQDSASTRGAIIVGVSRFTRLSVQVGILGLGATLVLAGELSPGHMIAGAILLGRALAPVEQAMTAWRGFISSRGGYGRLQTLLRTFPEDRESIELPDPVGNITVSNLGFKPAQVAKPILQNVSFALPAGEMLALIGPSASGKSTLCRLLMGVWPPTVGNVRLDSAEVHSWDRVVFGRHVGYLPQGVELFAGTVRQNIARMKDGPDQAVIDAAIQADVHEMILHLPDGYDTRIGAGGAGLSAGQRQRIGLARALYGDPIFVVLDEPNANLDRLGEAALIRALHALKARKVTVIIVVHHAALLEVVDKILILKDGQVDSFGPRNEIIAALKGGERVPQAPQAGLSASAVLNSPNKKT